MYSRETEIRHISPADIYKLAQILDPNNSWRKLMQIIPKDPHSNSPEDMAYKYNYDHVRLVESASVKRNRMATEILLDEWATSGRKRPTLGILLELLVKAQLFRAADLVAVDYLKEETPARPTKGPAAQIDTSIPLDSEFINNVESMLNAGDFPGSETLNDNAKDTSLAENNIDFYEKYHPNRKHIDIPQPQQPPSNELNNFSHPSADNGIAAVQQQPAVEQAEPSQLQSDLMNFSTRSITNSEVIPILSELFPAAGSSDADISQYSLNETVNIPMLSALNIQQSSDDVLPDISALNIIADAELDDDKLKPPEESSSVLSSSSVSSLSSSPEDDDLSAPNLSILDQRSSNNDSSLTNVTGTSEDNSFDMSINEGSNDNIPCLSALK